MTKFEIVSEIVTVTSILIKTDREDITMKRELGLRNENGNELNNVSFNKLFKSLSEDEIEQIIEQFNEGFEDIHRYLMMYTSGF